MVLDLGGHALAVIRHVLGGVPNQHVAGSICEAVEVGEMSPIVSPRGDKLHLSDIERNLIADIADETGSPRRDFLFCFLKLPRDLLFLENVVCNRRIGDKT